MFININKSYIFVNYNKLYEKEKGIIDAVFPKGFERAWRKHQARQAEEKTERGTGV